MSSATQVDPSPPTIPDVDKSPSREAVLEQFCQVRQTSERLCAPLEIEDYMLQTQAFASPAKWHLAHVTWFFETFVLKPFAPRYRELSPAFHRLFNSYYEQLEGELFPRDKRGLISRPTVREVYDYRSHVDREVMQLLEDVEDKVWATLTERIVLGCHHEQQHQELLLTDLKTNLGFHPLLPAYREDLPTPGPDAPGPLDWEYFAGGLVEVGNPFTGDFAYDNEGPRHRVFLAPYQLASRPVTNGEYLAFMADGGYRRADLWLSDGWQVVKSQGWRAPDHWHWRDDQWCHYTLGGLRPVDEAAPVCHVSYYEADAYARWAGKRLPSEAEWEVATAAYPVEGHFCATGWLQPVATPTATGKPLRQLYGDVWEWTQSPYIPYPGFRPANGALGEYNGKFMANQMVLRGGSCATAQDHIRLTYRNFFYLHERWQFTGFRLADDT